MKAILCAALAAVSLFRVDIVWTGQPEYEYGLWGDSKWIDYDPVQHVWINKNYELEAIFKAMDRQLGYRKHSLPQRVPERKEIHVKFDPLWRRENLHVDFQMAMASALAVPNRRFRLINVEHTVNELAKDKTEFRLWPHLGLLYVGTVADNEGWDVTLHDELVEGYVNLEHIVQPGDIVGLSLVATGMERGVELARQAKRLGASYVVAGNDSAIFRADQVLRLPDHPIDAVFATNSLTAVRQFLRQVGTVELDKLDIPGVAVVPTGFTPSNEESALRAERLLRTQLRRDDQYDPQDVFVVPKLGLFGDEYWQKVWYNYRSIFGHKHDDRKNVRNALSLFAQGCTRAAGGTVCTYCTIHGVADIRLPRIEYLEKVLETYASFGINYVFNTTDSVLEMRRVYDDLKSVGAFFPEGLMIYGRAWGLAHKPQAIDAWLSLTGGRLLVNVGMDSGDERILSYGVDKASQAGSRLDENRQAVRNIASSGAHLHYSLIFGSPGETRESCERSLEFFDWTRATLGRQLDQCETDIYWLNHGSPASRVFRDYSYAQELAALAGKELSRSVWEHRFHRHRDTLVVPWECEEAWYDCFTSISVEEAQKYNAQVAQAMARHEDAAPGRGNAFRPG